MGLCAEGPLVSTSNGDSVQARYRRRCWRHPRCLDGRRSSRLVCRTDVPFFQRQKKIVLENSGVIDPERIEDYIAAGGYGALMQRADRDDARRSDAGSDNRAACAAAAARVIPPG